MFCTYRRGDCAVDHKWIGLKIIGSNTRFGFVEVEPAHICMFM